MLQKIKKDALECVKSKSKKRVTRYQADVKGGYLEDGPPNYIEHPWITGAALKVYDTFDDALEAIERAFPISEGGRVG